MIGLNEKQKKTLVDFVVSEPNTQTPMAIIALAVLSLSAEEDARDGEKQKSKG